MPAVGNKEDVKISLALFAPLTSTGLPSGAEAEARARLNGEPMEESRASSLAAASLAAAFAATELSGLEALAEAASDKLTGDGDFCVSTRLAGWVSGPTGSAEA